MQNRDRYLQLKPTQRIKAAIQQAHDHLSQTQVYSGIWHESDTLRHLIALPYIKHQYPTKNLPKLDMRNIKLTEDEFQAALSNRFEGESKLALTYRLIVSGLIKMGYLKVDDMKPGKKRYPKPFRQDLIELAKQALEDLPEIRIG